MAFHQKVDGEKFHVNRSPAVCKALASIIQDFFPDVPADIIKTFVRVRTFVRIKAINNQLKKLRFKRVNKNAQFIHSFIPDIEPLNDAMEGEAGQEWGQPEKMDDGQPIDQQMDECLDALLNSGSDWDLISDSLDKLNLLC